MRHRTVACVWLALAGTARAADDVAADAPPAVDAEPPTESERLERAVASYQSGRWDAAQIDLTQLISDATSTEGVRQEARVYLGELLYARGDVDGARQVFEQVLAVDADFQVDPFRHPPEILVQFEIARSSVIRPPPVAVRSSFPALGYAGFGLYQLTTGRSLVGATLLVTETSFAALSIGYFVANLPLSARTYEPGSDDEQQAKVRKYLQVGMGVGSWGTHLVSLVDAQHQWRKNRVGVALTFGDAPVGLVVSGRL